MWERYTHALDPRHKQKERDASETCIPLPCSHSPAKSPAPNTSLKPSTRRVVWRRNVEESHLSAVAESLRKTGRQEARSGFFLSSCHLVTLSSVTLSLQKRPLYLTMDGDLFTKGATYNWVGQPLGIGGQQFVGGRDEAGRPWILVGS